MCTFFAVSRSGYYAFVHSLDRPEKDAALAEVIAQQRERSFCTYGYRRMWLWLKSQNIFHNPKTVLRVMKKYGLLSEIRRRRKWQQMGQQVHRYENLLNREFHADRPNSKWVTDISYIHTKQGVLYLSMIRDLYDNSIVAYKTGTEQTVSLVLDTIQLAMRKEKKRAAAELHLHSDQGFQYTSRAYFNLTQAYVCPSRLPNRTRPNAAGTGGRPTGAAGRPAAGRARSRPGRAGAQDGAGAPGAPRRSAHVDQRKSYRLRRESDAALIPLIARPVRLQLRAVLPCPGHPPDLSERGLFLHRDRGGTGKQGAHAEKGACTVNEAAVCPDQPG